ncbi:M1 family metallopeptidase [Sphingomonas piscis]|uniref:Aminopeptidase N n=1 Tax=Sphingomonas piscis TaxID=2714943 RepID=A0A6G7YM94_9SPHN|nr:M1 family metallopeptidase [Sphingomonas piscis]QIK77863.1 M1 family metallopeptidase [Sphingomonas piscis]
MKRQLAIAAAAALVVATVPAILLWKKHEQGRELTSHTRESGLPLSAEQQSVRFTDADLTFVIHPGRRFIEGKSLLGLTVVKPIQRIHFDLDRNLPIKSIAVNGTSLDRSKWSNPDGRIAIALPRAFAAGERLQVAIDYSGHPHVAVRAPWDGGFVWTKTADGKPWVASAVQGEGCDLFWPCFDNSRVEIGTVTQHIVVPEGLAAPSNGRLLGVDKLDKGWTRWNWRASNPNNYAIAIDIAPYKLTQSVHRSRYGNSFPIQFWHLPGEEKQAQALVAELGGTIDFFEATVGPYPFGDEKVGVVATPHLGMEHQTINAYGNKYKPAPEGYDWLLNHEFSHEWFGNQLTNGDWDDMWLHEGFGTYMQPLYLGWLRGRMVYDAAMFKQRQSLMNKFPIVSGKSRTEEQVYNAESGPGNDIYYKGSWVLHTLRGLIGDEPFYRSVRRLVYGRPDPRPGNFKPRFGSTNEFVAIVNQESGRNLDWFFNVYLRHAPLPRLLSWRTGNSLNLQWQTPRGLPFPMPVTVEVDGQRSTVAMNGGRGALTLPSPQALVTIDPDSMILRHAEEMDRFRDVGKSAASK